MDIYGVCKAVPDPHWLWHSRELALCLTGGNALKNKPWWQVAGPEGTNMGEPILPFLCCGVA